MFQPRLFAVQLRLLDEFLHHFVYRRALDSRLRGLNAALPAFWEWTNTAHIECAINAWCMVFGSTTHNQTHWRNVFEEDENILMRFRTRLETRLGLNEDAWRAYHRSMLAFRDNYIAHRHDAPPPVPHLDTAKDVVLAYDEWVRTEIAPHRIDHPLLREDLASLRDAADTEIASAVNDAVARNRAR
jgi:hypothetical protein